MAAVRIPAPGSQYGPCEKPCQHADCAGNRRDAATPCHHCGVPVGYETPVYIYGHGKLAHAACAQIHQQDLDRDK